MPYPFPLNLETFLAIEEVTYGIDPTPTAAVNAIRHIKHFWPDHQGEYAWPNLNEDLVTNSLIEAIPGTPKGRMIAYEIELELRGSGVPYATGSVVPEVDPLLISCGLSRVHDDTASSETVTYSFADSGHLSSTQYLYAGGKLFIVVGCQANLVWNMAAGMLGRQRFRVTGLLTSITDSDPPPDGTFDTTEAPAAVNMGLIIDPGTPWTPNFTTAEIDLGNNMPRLDDANAVDGIERFAIPSRQPRFRISARTELLTTYDPYADRTAVTLHTLAGELGQVQYNSVNFNSADMRLSLDPAGAEDNEFAGWDLEYMLRDLDIVFD